jgi:hypothetical protein
MSRPEVGFSRLDGGRSFVCVVRVRCTSGTVLQMRDGSCRMNDQGELTVSDVSKAYHSRNCRTRSRSQT